MSVVVIRRLNVIDEPAKLTKVFVDSRQARTVAAQWSREGYLVELIDLGRQTSRTLESAERDANFPSHTGDSQDATEAAPPA